MADVVDATGDRYGVLTVRPGTGTTLRRPDGTDHLAATLAQRVEVNALLGFTVTTAIIPGRVDVDLSAVGDKIRAALGLSPDAPLPAAHTVAVEANKDGHVLVFNGTKVPL